MDRLNYISTERMFEGVIVELTDASVTIDIKGRLGQFKLPLRMLISEFEVQIGQEVGFMMSYPEVLAAEANPKYVEAIAETERRREEIKKRNEQRKEQI